MSGAAAGFERARVLAARGSTREARAALAELLSHDPEHVGALLLEGGLLLEERDGGAALALYQRAVAIAPESAEAWNGLARCLHALGRDVEALQAGQTALGLLGRGENFRETAPVYLTLVWCLRELRRYREALRLAEEGLARTPDAVLAQWASTVEEELAAAEKEDC